MISHGSIWIPGTFLTVKIVPGQQQWHEKRKCLLIVAIFLKLQQLLLLLQFSKMHRPWVEKYESSTNIKCSKSYRKTSTLPHAPCGLLQEESLRDDGRIVTGFCRPMQLADLMFKALDRNGKVDA